MVDKFPYTEQHLGWMLEELLSDFNAQWSSDAKFGTDKDGKYCIRVSFKNRMGHIKKYKLRIEENNQEERLI